MNNIFRFIILYIFIRPKLSITVFLCVSKFIFLLFNTLFLINILSSFHLMTPKILLQSV